MKRFRPWLLPIFPLVAGALLLFGPLIFSGRAMFWGVPALQFVPWRAYAWELIKAGELPLWNPLLGMGAPLLANYQSALLYPPNLLLFILSAAAGTGWAAWGQAVVVVLHLVWSGIGMAYLGQALGYNRLGMAVSALAYGLSGYLVARAGFLSINAAAAWLPWVLLGCFRLVKVYLSADQSAKPRQALRAWMLLWFSLTMQLFAGHAQTTWYALLLAGGWTLYWFWWWISRQASTQPPSTKPVWPRAGRTLVALGLAGLAAIASAAVQLWPTWEYLRQSQRAAAVDYELAMTYSFWPWRLLGLWAPGLFGSPASGDYWGYANYWEDAIYVGLLPFFLALVTIIWAFRRRERAENPLDTSGNEIRAGWRYLVRALAVLILVTLVLALGKNTPVFPWLYRHVPSFALFQAPTRYTIWLEFALALLAGIGAHRWRRPSGRGLYWTRLGIMAGVAVLVGASATYLALGQVKPTFIRAVAWMGVWWVAAGLLSLGAPPGGEHTPPNKLSTNRQVRWGWLVAAVVVADLVIASWGLHPGIDRTFYSATHPAAPVVKEMLGDSRLYLPVETESDLKFERFFRFSAYKPAIDWEALRKTFLPNLNLLDGLPVVNNFDPLVPGRYARWMNALEALPLEQKSIWLNLMAVGVVEHIDATAQTGTRLEPVPTQDHQRAYWRACVLAVPDENAAWETIQVTPGMLDEFVILETSQQEPGECQPAGATLAWLVDQPDQIQIQVSAPQAGYLVLADTWYPGWQADVDGQASQIYAANTLFRAVQVPAGDHVVRLDYRPQSVYAGMWVSGLCLLAISGLVVVANRREMTYST